MLRELKRFRAGVVVTNTAVSVAGIHLNPNKFAYSNLGRGPRRGAVAHIRRKVPKFAPKVPLHVDRSPNPTKYLIPGPVRPMKPYGIRIRSAVLPQCIGQTDRPTDARTYEPTDRPRESLTTRPIGRCATRATRPNNTRWQWIWFRRCCFCCCNHCCCRRCRDVK